MRWKKKLLSLERAACANKFAYITTYIKEKILRFPLSINKLFPHTSGILSLVSYVHTQ